ncbi:MAG: hypothetical protein L3J16_06250, partial [Anaerolineales bacterium]|nr:hypothetical protein [Anaerolineales bacterium]
MDAKAGRSLWLGLGGILWILAVLLGYVSTHKPFGAMQVLGVLHAFWQMAVAVGLLSLAGALGMCVFRPREEWLSRLGTLAVQAALGIGVLSIGILLMGFTLGFSPLIFSGLFIALVLLLRQNLLIWLRQWSAVRVLWRKNSLFERVLLGGTSLILAAGLLKSLAPPLAFDSLV